MNGKRNFLRSLVYLVFVSNRSFLAWKGVLKKLG
jgi:hypothetical protein